MEIFIWDGSVVPEEYVAVEKEAALPWIKCKENEKRYKKKNKSRRPCWISKDKQRQI